MRRGLLVWPPLCLVSPLSHPFSLHPVDVFWMHVTSLSMHLQWLPKVQLIKSSACLRPGPPSYLWDLVTFSLFLNSVHSHPHSPIAAQPFTAPLLFSSLSWPPSYSQCSTAEEEIGHCTEAGESPFCLLNTHVHLSKLISNLCFNILMENEDHNSFLVALWRLKEIYIFVKSHEIFQK